MNWKDERGYTITIEGIGKNTAPMIRHALFVFKKKSGGIYFIETGYLDPWGGGHSLHQFDGDLSEDEHSVTLIEENGSRMFIVEPDARETAKISFQKFIDKFHHEKNYEGEYQKMLKMFFADEASDRKSGGYD